MAFLCGEYKTIIYRGKGLSDCLLREVNKLSYTLNLSAYCASIEGAIVIIEESQLCFALKRFKFHIQKTDTKKPLIEWLHCLYGAGTKSRTRDLLELSRVSQLRFVLNTSNFRYKKATH